MRVVLAGSAVFYVWGSFGVNSGEDAPAWADPDLHLTLFAGAAETPDARHTRETLLRDGAPVGYRACARHPRVTAELELRREDEGMRLCLTLANPQPDGAISGDDALTVTLAPYSYRVFVLE